MRGVFISNKNNNNNDDGNNVSTCSSRNNITTPKKEQDDGVQSSLSSSSSTTSRQVGAGAVLSKFMGGLRGSSPISSNTSTTSTVVSTDVSESSDGGGYHNGGHVVIAEEPTSSSSSSSRPPHRHHRHKNHHHHRHHHHHHRQHTRGGDGRSIIIRKEVTWSDHARVHKTLARNDYTEFEKMNAFFQREEYDQITSECVKQVQKMMNGEQFKDKKYCSRGLEGHTALAAIAKQQNRMAAYAAVLDEQDEQFEMKTNDDEAISFIYTCVSSSSQLWATTIGLRDQKAAEDYLFDVS